MDVILWTAIKGMIFLGFFVVCIGLISLYVSAKIKTKSKTKQFLKPTNNHKSKYNYDPYSAIVKNIDEVIEVDNDEQDKTLEDATWPYNRKSLLTFTEQRFFALLHEALPEHQIFVQVALNQMIKVDNSYNWAKWYNRIAQMSVDFVISNNKGYVIAAIELDDKSHDNPKRQAQDAKKDKALTSAGIYMLRYRCESMPNISTIQNDIEQSYNADKVTTM